MSPCAREAGPTRGSILLPVIVVLLLIASAATAMTLQARTSLREAAIRRDRLRLGFLADGAARAVAEALSAAVTAQKAPPFRVDGTAQACAIPGGGRLVLMVQDEGGLVDLNKARRELLLLVLQRAGVGGWDAKAMTDAILQRREGGGTRSTTPVARRQPVQPSPGPFTQADEIDRLPGMTSALFDQLRPVFTVASGAATLDPAVAGPAVRAIVEPRELAGPAMATMVAPSSHDAYTLTAVVSSPQGTRVARRAGLHLEASDAAVSYTSWDAPVSFDPLPASSPDSPFCQAAARLIGPA